MYILSYIHIYSLLGLSWEFPNACRVLKIALMIACMRIALGVSSLNWMLTCVANKTLRLQSHIFHSKNHKIIIRKSI